MRTITVTVPAPALGVRPAERPEPRLKLDVAMTELGNVRILCDPATAATLAGREGFRDLIATWALLQGKIAEAWYAADCPPSPTPLIEQVGEYVEHV